MKTPKLILLAVLAILLELNLSSCSKDDSIDSEIVGTWNCTENKLMLILESGDSTDCSSSPSGGGTCTFNSDGTYSIRNLHYSSYYGLNYSISKSVLTLKCAGGVGDKPNWLDFNVNISFKDGKMIWDGSYPYYGNSTYVMHYEFTRQ